MLFKKKQENPVFKAESSYNDCVSIRKQINHNWNYCERVSKTGCLTNGH